MKQKKVVIYTAAYGVIGLAVVLLFRTLWAVGQGGEYSYYTVSSVMLELMFSLLTTSTYISIVRSGRLKRLFVRLFLWMLVIVTIGMLGDVFAWGIGMETAPWAGFARWLGAFLRDAMGFPLMVVYTIYLLSYVNEDKRELKRFAWLVGGLCADGLFLVIISQITARSRTQPWHLWDHPWVFFFFLSVPVVVTLGIIFYFRRMLTNRKAVSFLFYELVVLAAIAVDIVLVKMTLAYTVAALSLLSLYVSVQMEYEKQQEEALVRQRIAIMLSQIRPHFLYNVLTGIRALCRIDPKKAEEALLDFTSYLRANLNCLENEHCIPFSRELEHTQHYLRLEKMRYGDELQVIYETPVTQFSVPSLTLEPIVENAVRHGVMQRESGGTVTISTAESAKYYLITVTDDGVGFDTSSPMPSNQEHVGIINVRERLASMCGGTLDIQSTPGAGTVAVLSIPKQGGTLYETLLSGSR